MEPIWANLPIDAINTILTYDGRITYRSGVYMNKMLDPDISHPLILERMRFQRYRRFYSGVSFVTIILDTGKHICYLATCRGLRLTLFTPLGDDVNVVEEQLFTTVEKNI